MQEFQVSTTAYKLRFRDDDIEFGLLNWAPLKQLNAWAISSDTFTLRASIMAFGWRQFLLSGPRSHHFSTLGEAKAALDQLVEEASLLKMYSISPNMSLGDLFLMHATQSEPVDPSVEAEVYERVQIADVLVSPHDLLVTSVQDSRSSAAWYVGYYSQDEGHLLLSAKTSYVSWVGESEIENAWSSVDELTALEMAKRVTRAEHYYAYPIRLQKGL